MCVCVRIRTEYYERSAYEKVHGVHLPLISCQIGIHSSYETIDSLI